MTLFEAKECVEYRIEAVKLDDEELLSFLFSLGCYKGEPITVITHRKKTCIVAIKDGRYSIDAPLARAIQISE